MRKLFICFALLSVIIQICCALSEQEWLEYKEKYEKQYDTFEEDHKRKEIFFANSKIISEHNERHANGLETYSMELNEFSDLTAEEVTQKFTAKFPKELDTHEITLRNITLRSPLPNYVNWVERGFNTAVQHQGTCSDCYAFGAVAALESHYYIKYKNYVKLSEQDVLDCSIRYGNFGCKYGYAANVFEYARQEGVALLHDVPYIAKENVCQQYKTKQRVWVQNYYTLGYGDENIMKQVVATIGPITVEFASTPSFSKYGGGIYYDPTCNNAQINHVLLIVGYGTENGQDYWIIKNSWGPLWGMGGYAKIARNYNLCSIASKAVYPIIL